MKLLLVFSYPSVLDIPDQQQRIEKYIIKLKKAITNEDILVILKIVSFFIKITYLSIN
jgi:hypothetical protein